MSDPTRGCSKLRLVRATRPCSWPAPARCGSRVCTRRTRLGCMSSPTNAPDARTAIRLEGALQRFPLTAQEEVARDVLAALWLSEGAVSGIHDGGDDREAALVAFDAAGEAEDVELLAADALTFATTAIEHAAMPDEPPSRSTGMTPCETGFQSLVDTQNAHAADLTANELAAMASRAALMPHGTALVGKRVRIFWPADDAWYLGAVASFSSLRGYGVRYDRVPGQDDLPFVYTWLEEGEWELEPSEAAPSSPHTAASHPAPPTCTRVDTPATVLASPQAAPSRFTPPGCACIDFVMENPIGALWLMLFTKHPTFARWPTVTLSYCKLASGRTRYRKTTRFVSSLPSAREYRPPCSATAPCAYFRVHARHECAIGQEAERSIQGYYLRSRVPSSIVAGVPPHVTLMAHA